MLELDVSLAKRHLKTAVLAAYIKHENECDLYSRAYGRFSFDVNKLIANFTCKLFDELHTRIKIEEIE